MKRVSALVSYSSSDEESGNGDPSSAPPRETQRQKRCVRPGFPSSNKVTSFSRKLPPLSGTIVTPPPVDDPALHQGRIRTTPHVEGQWAAHVYVAVKLVEGSPLCKLVRTVLDDSKEMVPTLQEISQLDDGRRELHISLSRPIFLRAHQREQLKAAVRNVAREHPP
jgi:hypothetical protein